MVKVFRGIEGRAVIGVFGVNAVLAGVHRASVPESRPVRVTIPCAGRGDVEHDRRHAAVDLEDDDAELGLRPIGNKKGRYYA